MFQQNHYKTSYQISDHKLWEDFKSGDQKSYSTIYDQEADSLFKYGIHLCNNEQLVEDVIHDLFVYLWTNREKLGEIRSIRLYLKSSFRRSLLKKIRKEKIFQREQILEQFAYKFAVLAEEVKNEAENNDLIRAEIDSVLKSLSKRQREIIYLRFYQNLSYEEIAAHLDIDLSYTYNVVSKAYSTMKKLIKVSCAAV